LRTILVLGVCAAPLLSSALLTNTARAHINMYGPLQGRGGDQKAGPCEGKPRGSGPVYTFEPGATITIGVDETIAHDGYFRIAFDDDGEDDFVDPRSIDPINPNRYGPGKKCEGTAADRCGASDFCNVVSKDGGPTVLWDNLDPHVPGNILNRKQWTWTIQLPNVECDNCTLQILQVMEDPPGHGPFDGKSDLYYRCVDIVLKRGAGNTPGTTTAKPENKGINCTMAEVTDAGVMLPDASVEPVFEDAGTAPGPGTGSGGHAGGDADHDHHDQDQDENGGVPSSPGTSHGGGAPAPLPPRKGSDGCTLSPHGSAPPFAALLLLLTLRRRRRQAAGTAPQDRR
jgi:hypothetical protein